MAPQSYGSMTSKLRADLLPVEAAERRRHGGAEQRDPEAGPQRGALRRRACASASAKRGVLERARVVPLDQRGGRAEAVDQRAADFVGVDRRGRAVLRPSRAPDLARERVRAPALGEEASGRRRRRRSRGTSRSGSRPASSRLVGQGEERRRERSAGLERGFSEVGGGAGERGRVPEADRAPEVRGDGVAAPAGAGRPRMRSRARCRKPLGTAWST